MRERKRERERNEKPKNASMPEAPAKIWFLTLKA
jgi:hypothetical protein